MTFSAFTFWLLFSPACILAQQCFTGWADDVFPVRICLDTLRGPAKGSLEFIGSDLKFELEGLGLGDSLRLSEFDREGNLSGFVFLGLQDGRWKGRWMNAGRNIESQILLLDPEQDYISHKCGGNKWIKAFEFKHQSGLAEGLIIRSAQQIAYGYLYLPDGQHLRLKGQCLSRSCERVWLRDMGESDLQLLLTFEGSEGLFVKKADGELMGKGTVSDIWTMDCFGLITYNSSFDLLYPELDPNFQKAMLEQLGKWSREVQYREKTVFGSGELEPEYRWLNRYYGWLEIDAANEGFMSGIIELIGPGGGVAGFAFSYDLNKNEFIVLQEHLRRVANVEELAEVFFAEKENVPDWKYATVRKDGLILRTDFDPIFGRSDWLIPFDKYGKYFKNDLIELAND